MHDLVFRRHCCGISVTIHCPDNGPKAEMAHEAKRMLSSFCPHDGTETTTRSVPAEWSYAPHNHQAVVGVMPQRKGI